MAADDSAAREPETQKTLLVAHLEMLRKHPQLQQAMNVVIPESNLAFEAMHLDAELARVFKKDGRYLCLKEDRYNAGLRTNNLLKHGMVESLNRELRLQHVHFCHEFMCAEAQRLERESFRQLQADEMRDELTKEMRTFMRIVKLPRDPTRDSVVQFSGKLHGGCDDKVMAFLMAHTGMKIFLTSDTYQSYR